jgi:hypothetical protein
MHRIKLIRLQCITKGKACVYTQSKRGGSRIRKRRVSSSDSEAVLSDNREFNHVALSILPELNQGNCVLAILSSEGSSLNT